MDRFENSVIVGEVFTESQSPERETHSTRYEIKTITKVNPTGWILNIRLPPGGIDTVVPLPVRLDWAGDTAVLSIDENVIEGQSIPECRILIDQDRYVGVWRQQTLAGELRGTLQGGVFDDRAIARRFREIYQQIQRVRKDNPQQFPELQKTLVPEIDAITKRLGDEGAGARKPAKQHLLWIGNHCLKPMLLNPGAEQNALDVRFQIHFQRVDQEFEAQKPGRPVK